jgi:hypothetical protein
MIDYAKLIPELPDWNNGKGIDVDSWIGCSGDFQLAVGYSTLFWPRFVELDGYVLREGFSTESLRSFQQQSSPSCRSVEAVMNHLHIAAIHYHDLSHCTADHALYLGRVLREIYQAKLAWQFPDRRFEVVFDESPREDVMAYEITFYQSDAA